MNTTSFKDCDIPSEECFDFRCPNCGSDKIWLKPINVPYLEKERDRNDEDSIWKHYNNVRNIRDVLMKSDRENVLVVCDDCGIASTPKEKLSKVHLENWLVKKYGERQNSVF